jgi:hypothetical protein
MRIEIFVRPDGNAWEVDAGSTGYLQSHPTNAAALRQAREVARVTWVEGRQPSTVKVLGPEGWKIDAFFGLEGLGG